MLLGQELHKRDIALERRRVLRFYALAGARREFRPHLFSQELGLTGVPDLVLVAAEETVPVEIKVTEHAPGPRVLLQLAAYALLLAETNRPPTYRAFVRNLPSLKTFELFIGGTERAAVLKAVNSIRAMLSKDRCPPPTPVRNRCRLCEYLQLCPDVWE
jgi:CRISPR-associated protein Cas4